MNGWMKDDEVASEAVRSTLVLFNFTLYCILYLIPVRVRLSGDSIKVGMIKREKVHLIAHVLIAEDINRFGS